MARCSTTHPSGSSWLTRRSPLALILLLGVSRPALAEDPEQRAAALFEQSAAAYEAGDLDRAAELLERAYALDPDPTLLYNLARTYEGLGRLEAAVSSYRKFLEQSPEASDRGAIEKRIQTLEAQIAERQRLLDERRSQSPPPTEDASPARGSSPETRSGSTVPWIVAGAGGVVLIAGGVLGVLATREHRAAEDDPSFMRAQELATRAENLALAANIAFAVGGVAAAVGLTWGVIDATASQQPHARLPPTLPSGVWMRGVF